LSSTIRKGEVHELERKRAERGRKGGRKEGRKEGESRRSIERSRLEDREQTEVDEIVLEQFFE